MTFTINQATLLSALNIAGKAIGNNTIVPALSNYLFDLNGNNLSITGSNMEVFITTSVEVENSTFTGSIMVPAQRISSLLKEIQNIDIVFDLDKITTDKGLDFYNMSLTAGKGKYNITCETGEDYPVMKCSPEVEFTISSETLLEGIKKTLFATDKTGVHEQLAGVLISFNNNEVTFTASDHRILSTNSFSVDASCSKSFIVPTKVLSFIPSLPVDSFINIKISDRNIVIQLNEDTIIKSVLIDQLFPDYKNFIPSDNSRIIKINRNELSGALKRVGCFSDFSINAISFKIEESTLSIHSKNELNESASEYIECKITGEPMEVWLKGDQALSILSKLGSEDVYIHLSAFNRPVLFTEDLDSIDNKKDLMLAMPVNMMNVA